jgi:PAS domain S-box-containing protein
MQTTYENLSSIVRILSEHPEGRMMKDLTAALCLNRNAVAKYVEILFQQGKIDIRQIGRAKIITLSKRIPFSILSEISPDYIIGTDRNLICADANARFYAWTGCTPIEILGKPIQNLPVPLFQRSPVADLARTGISSPCEPVKISCKLQSGEFFYEIRSIPVVFGDYTTGSAVLIKDITHSETAAKTISILEERYRALTGTQSEVIVHTSPDHTILFANPAFAELAGIPPEQLMGKKYRLKILEEDIHKIEEHFRSINCEDPEKGIEHRVLVHSGELRWIRWKNRGIFRQAMLIEYHSHGIDITEVVLARNRLQYYHENMETMIREKTDEFLRINQDLIREIQKRKQTERNLQKTQFCVNNSNDMILWTDETGRVTSSNKSALTILGIPHGHVPCFRKPGLSGPLQPIPWQEIWESAKQDGFILFEAIMHDRNEKLFYMEVLGNYLSFDDNEGCCFFVRDITERKQWEERLMLLKISVDSAFDEVFWMDMAGNILYVNDATCTTLGYSRKELCAMHIFEISPGLNPEQWEKHIADLRRNKKQFFQTRHRRKDGVIIDVEIGSIYVTQGEVEQKICFVRDITERKRMEVALRESEEMFATAFYHGPLMLAITDIETDSYLDVNEQFIRISGYSRDEIIGKSAPELAWISREEQQSIFRELERTGRVAGRELRLTKKGGEPAWCRYFGQKITVAGKERLLSLAEDITDRKLAEGALHEVEEEYKQIVESFVDTRYETDANGIIRVISPSVYAMTGWRPEDLVEKSILTLYADPRDRQELIDRLERDPVVSGFELTLRKHDGMSFHVFVNARKKYSASGEPEGIIGSIRDITKNVRARNTHLAGVNRYRIALDAATDPCWELDTSKSKGIFSSGWNAALGYASSEADCSYATWLSVLHPEDRGIVERKLLDQIRKNVELPAVEFRVRTGQDTWKWIHWQGKVIEKDAGGNPVRIAGISTDISNGKPDKEET